MVVVTAVGDINPEEPPPPIEEPPLDDIPHPLLLRPPVVPAPDDRSMKLLGLELLLLLLLLPVTDDDAVLVEFLRCNDKGSVRPSFDDCEDPSSSSDTTSGSSPSSLRTPSLAFFNHRRSFSFLFLSTLRAFLVFLLSRIISLMVPSSDDVESCSYCSSFACAWIDRRLL